MKFRQGRPKRFESTDIKVDELLISFIPRWKCCKHYSPSPYYDQWRMDLRHNWRCGRRTAVNSNYNQRYASTLTVADSFI